MSAARRAPSMQRARKLLSAAEARHAHTRTRMPTTLATPARRGHPPSPPQAWPHEAERLRPLDRRHLDGAAGGRGGRKAGGQQGRPCECCGEADGRDAVRCGTCPARRHLMCFFPPLADACEAAGWQCDGCVRAVASGGVLRSLPAVGETIEVDIAEVRDLGRYGEIWGDMVDIAEARTSETLLRDTFRHFSETLFGDTFQRDTETLPRHFETLPRHFRDTFETLRSHRQGGGGGRRWRVGGGGGGGASRRGPLRRAVRDVALLRLARRQ